MKLPTAIFASVYMIGLFTLVGCLVIKRVKNDIKEKIFKLWEEL